MIKAFGYGMDEAQCELVRKMVIFLSPDDWEIIDLRSFDPEVNKQDVVLTYGNKAQRKLEDFKCRFKVEFPDPYRLDASLDENKEDREQASEKLKQLKQALDSDANNDLPKTEEVHNTNKTLKLTEELPLQLTTTVVKELERQQREQGLDHWSGRTVDGRSIKVTVEPERGTADINMTFAELYAVMGLKEAFRVKELEFVYKPSSATK